MHSQMKRKLKFFKNQKSISVVPFNKDVAPGKKPQILISLPVCLFRTLEYVESINFSSLVFSNFYGQNFSGGIIIHQEFMNFKYVSNQMGTGN